MKKLFLFNPTNEIAVFNDTVSYTPPAFLRKFEKDAALLLGFAGDAGDILITESDIAGTFRRFWEELDVGMPDYVSLKDIAGYEPDKTLFPVPWGWNRSVHRLLTPLRPFFDAAFRGGPNYEWKEHYRNFFSRETSVRFMNEVRKITTEHDLISIPYAPDIVTSMSEIAEWSKINDPPYVYKTPWSSSGRGLYPVTDEEFVERCGIWVRSRLKQQKKLIIEPWLNKKQDLSFQFYIQSDGTVRLLGVNFFEAGRTGEFKKEYIGMAGELKEQLGRFSLPEGWIEETVEVLGTVLKRSSFHENYCGPIGIDGIFFEDDSGKIRLHPCIEINFRMNMGFVNLKLKDKLHPEAKGEWTIRQFRQGEWSQFVKERTEHSPVVMQDNRIIRGFLPMVPWEEEQLYGVWAELG